MLVIRNLLRIPLNSPFYNSSHSVCLVSHLSRSYIHINIANCNNENCNNSGEIKIPGLPEPPTNCCFSGCANCVWIKYAEDLSQIFDDADDKIKSIILDKVDDPNMRAFLSMELQSVKFKKK